MDDRSRSVLSLRSSLMRGRLSTCDTCMIGGEWKCSSTQAVFSFSRERFVMMNCSHNSLNSIFSMTGPSVMSCQTLFPHQNTRDRKLVKESLSPLLKG